MGNFTPLDLLHPPVSGGNFAIDSSLISEPAIEPEKVNEPINFSSFFSFFFVILFIFLGAVASAYYFIIVPRVELAKYSKDTFEKIPPLRKDINDTGKAINNIYDLSFGQSNTDESKKLLLMIDTSKFLTDVKNLNNQKTGQVAGASTQTGSAHSLDNNFVSKVSSLYGQLEKSKQFGVSIENVLGVTTGDAFNVAQLRQIKDESSGGKQHSASTKADLDILKSQIAKSKDSSAGLKINHILVKIEETDEKTEKFIDQSSKTADYYYKISDIQIRLNPLLVSYTSLVSQVAQTTVPELFIDRLGEIKSSFGTLQEEMNKIADANLPQGIDELHSDNKKVFSILSSNINDVEKSISSKDYTSFARSILVLQQRLEPLVTRAPSLEVNFWQNNQYLRNYQTLNDEYLGHEKSLQDLVKENQVSFMGISL